MIAAARPSAALGIGYAFWLRGRAPLAAAWLFVVALAVLARVLPPSQGPVAFGAGVNVAMPPIVFAVPLVLVPVIALLNVLTHGPIDVSSASSSFPMHARLLPLSTRALVGWPMLFATLTVVSLWAALLALVLRPLGITTSVVWPTTIVVACTLWAQAVAWIPLPVRFVRAPMFLAFVGTPLLLATIDPRSGDHFWTFEIALLLWTAAAFAVATIGVSRARTGRTERRAPASTTPTVDGEPAPPFRSAASARRWYELHRTTSFFGKIFAITPLPLIAICVIGMVYPRFVLGHRLGAFLPISSTWAAIYVICGPLLASAAMGGFIGRFEGVQRQGLGSFFALRPISTMGLVADKLVSSALAAAIMFASAAVVAAFALGAYVTNAPPTVHTLLERFFARGGTLDVLLIAVGFLFLLWRNLAVDLWTTMGGRRWPSRVSAVLAAFAVAGFPAAAVWSRTHRAIEAAVLDVAPVVVAVLLAAKLLAAAAIARKLIARQLAPVRVVAIAAASWLVVTLAGVLLVSHFIDVTWRAAAVVALLVPLARLGLAPVALARSRHG